MPANRPPRPQSFVCTCGHRIGAHFNTKTQPQGPCGECGCRAFAPEPVCRCGHGKKAHTRHGSCNQSYLDGCRAFVPRENG